MSSFLTKIFGGSKQPAGLPPQPHKATKILLIRHAEKPNEEADGVLITGAKDSKSLSIKGWQRAGALAASLSGVDELGSRATTFLFASRSSSLRPHQTLVPLAEKLGVTINLDYGKGEEESMVNAAKSCGGKVLICWQHDFMAAVANQILGDSRTAPQTWPKERFDVTWVFNLDLESGQYRFTQAPQNLLAGDLREAIDQF